MKLSRRNFQLTSLIVLDLNGEHALSGPEIMVWPTARTRQSATWSYNWSARLVDRIIDLTSFSGHTCGSLVAIVCVVLYAVATCSVADVMALIRRRSKYGGNAVNFRVST